MRLLKACLLLLLLLGWKCWIDLFLTLPRDSHSQFSWLDQGQISRGLLYCCWWCLCGPPAMLEGPLRFQLSCCLDWWIYVWMCIWRLLINKKVLYHSTSIEHTFSVTWGQRLTWGQIFKMFHLGFTWTQTLTENDPDNFLNRWNLLTRPLEVKGYFWVCCLAMQFFEM